MRAIKPTPIGRDKMPDIRVSSNDKKFNVLVNYLQHGISYASKELAEAEANKLRTKYKEIYSK